MSRAPRPHRSASTLDCFSAQPAALKCFCCCENVQMGWTVKHEGMCKMFLCKNHLRLAVDLGSSVGPLCSDLFSQSSVPTLIPFCLEALTSFVQLMAYYRYWFWLSLFYWLPAGRRMTNAHISCCWLPTSTLHDYSTKTCVAVYSSALYCAFFRGLTAERRVCVRASVHLPPFSRMWSARWWELPSAAVEVRTTKLSLNNGCLTCF